MKHVLPIVTLAAILFSGLAQAQAKQEAAPEAGAPTLERQPAESLPTVPLTREILFRLLSADLALQRGQWKAAYGITLRVAKQTRDPRIARRAAEIALSAKQTAEAMAAVKLWRELAPNSEEATKYYLGFALIGDDLAEARPIFEQRLKEAPPQLRGILMFQMQRLLAGVKDKDKAYMLLQELLQPYLDTAEAHIALAQGALSRGDRALAAKEARQALAIKPESELAVLSLAQASDNLVQALATLESFVARNPRAREARLAYARLLVNQKQYDRARKEFEALLDIQPHDTTMLYSLGLLAAQANDPKNAERYLTAYLDELEKQQVADRDPSPVLLLLGQLADERGDADAAIRWLAQIEMQPGRNGIYVSAQIKQAQIAAKRGNIGESRKILASIETDTRADQAKIVVTEGQILRDAGDHAQALTVLAAGLKRHPKDTHMLYDHAMVAEKLDKLAEMEASLRQIIALDARNAQAYNALGYSLADRSLRLEEAHKLIEKAIQLAPEDAYIMDSMGWVLFRKGKVKEAEEWLRRAYEKRQDAEIGVHLGEVLWVTGRQDEARKLWRDAAQREPGNETLKNTLRRLKVNP